MIDESRESVAMRSARTMCRELDRTTLSAVVDLGLVVSSPPFFFSASPA